MIDGVPTGTKSAGTIAIINAVVVVSNRQISLYRTRSRCIGTGLVVSDLILGYFCALEISFYKDPEDVGTVGRGRQVPDDAVSDCDVRDGRGCLLIDV